MKQTAIVVGGVYYDGKEGVREVLGHDGEQVRYRILAAKIEQEYVHPQGMRSLLGQESGCTLAAFAQWAQQPVAPAERDALLYQLKARRLRLPPATKSLMSALGNEFTVDDPDFVPRAGVGISFAPHELRAARHAEKLGLLTVELDGVGGGDATLTDLGAAWIRGQLAAAGKVSCAKRVHGV